MVDGFSLVCPTCGKLADISLGLTPNEEGKLLCAKCGAEIPIPLAAPDDSPGDTTTANLSEVEKVMKGGSARVDR